MSERTGEPRYDEQETERLLAAAIISARKGGSKSLRRAICFGALAFGVAAVLSYVGFGWRDWPTGADIRPYPILPFVVAVAAASRLGGEPAKWTATVATLLFQAAVLIRENAMWVFPEFAPWLAQATVGIIAIALLISSSVDLLPHDKIDGGKGLRVVGYVKASLSTLYQKIVGNAGDINHDRPAPGAK